MYARHPDVVIRREYFGGVAFHKSTGTTVELDREACLLLEKTDGMTNVRALASNISARLSVDVSIYEIYNVVSTLRSHGFLVRNGFSPSVDATQWPEKTNYLSAPETVHLAVTHRCNYWCPSCYLDGIVEHEMTTAEIKSLIDEMAEIKVFQLAIGGGEPFLRDDLIEISSYAALCGIVPNITTNGSLLTSEVASELSGHIGQIQISVNGHNNGLHETTRDKGSSDAALRAMEILRKHNIRFGMNVLLRKDNINEIENIVAFGAKHGASTVNLIRPKPSKRDRNWYSRSALSRSDYRIVREAIRKAQSKYTIRITVDCALSFLMNTESPGELRRHGVYGCTGARRFLSIYPDGSAYPCSFLDMPEYCAGNVKHGLKHVWSAFQRFWQATQHLNGKCGTCKVKDYCTGCRAIAFHTTGDILGDDPACFNRDK